MSTNQPINTGIPSVEDQIDPDLAAALASRFGDPTDSSTPPPSSTPPADDTPEDEEVEPEELDDEEVEPGADDETPPESTPPSGFELTLPDGSVAHLDPETALAFYSFNQRLNSDPRLAQYLAAYNPYDQTPQETPTPAPVERGQTSAPGPSQLSLPDDLDLDDPNIKFLVDTVTRLSDNLNNLSEVASRHEQALTAEQEQQASTLINSAQASFRSKYEGLTDEDVRAISDAAARTGMVATYMSGVNPITGLPTTPDPLAALDLAFESVYWANPKYREAALAAQVKQQREDRIKKNKAGALSGNSGSQPRRAPDIANEKDRRDAMLAMVAQDMGLE